MARNSKETFETHFLGVGLYNTKNGFNIGAVLRAAGCFDAAYVVVSGERFRDYKTDYRCTDTELMRKRAPLFLGVPSLVPFLPVDCEPVVFERCSNSVPLESFDHPRRAFYVFGPEDGSVPSDLFPNATRVHVKSNGSLNLGMCANIVLHDRFSRLQIDESNAFHCPECRSHHWKEMESPPIDDGMKYLHCNSCGYEGVESSWTL